MSQKIGSFSFSLSDVAGCTECTHSCHSKNGNVYFVPEEGHAFFVMEFSENNGFAEVSFKRIDENLVPDDVMDVVAKTYSTYPF